MWTQTNAGITKTAPGTASSCSYPLHGSWARGSRVTPVHPGLVVDGINTPHFSAGRLAPFGVLSRGDYRYLCRPDRFLGLVRFPAAPLRVMLVRAGKRMQLGAASPPSRPSRDTLRMFALDPKLRLKPRFVFDSASTGLGISAPETYFQSSADKRTMVSADFSTNFHS
jgi:hypothetical protein